LYNDQEIQTKDGTAQAANQNPREQLDELGAQGVASVAPAELVPGRYDDLKIRLDFKRGEMETTNADERRLQTACKAPAFSRGTISADPWTAVYLPIPEKTRPELLRYARNWVDGLCQYADLDRRFEGTETIPGTLAQPFITREDFTPEHNFAAATARLAELNARLEIAAAAVQTREGGDPTQHSTAPAAAATPTGEPQRAEEPSNPAMRERPGNIRPARGARFFLESTTHRVAAVFEFFGRHLSPPPLTPGQVHDRLQAAGNLETLDANAAAEARQVYEAEKDEQIFRAN
jgi:hypothetical protein